jgi:hypothetical protein
MTWAGRRASREQALQHEFVMPHQVTLTNGRLKLVSVLENIVGWRLK